MNNWTIEEDQLLTTFYNQVQPFRRWKNISEKFRNFGIQKSVYECRERYINKLDSSINQDKWSEGQMRKLFECYNTFGSQWKKIQTIIQNRTQVQLKNNFFSFLRSFLVKMFKALKLKRKNQIKFITSSTIRMIYQGKKQFSQFKGKLRNYASAINYQLNTQNLSNIIQLHQEQIVNLYEILRKINNSKKDIKKKSVIRHSNCNKEIKKSFSQNQIQSINQSSQQEINKASQNIQNHNQIYDCKKVQNHKQFSQNEQNYISYNNYIPYRLGQNTLNNISRQNNFYYQYLINNNEIPLSLISQYPIYNQNIESSYIFELNVINPYFYRQYN